MSSGRIRDHRWRLVPVALAATVLLAGSAVGAQSVSAPVGASLGLPQHLTRPPDALDRANQLSTRPRPALGPVPEPARRWVPEHRVTVPGTARQVVVPAHEERRLSNTQVEVPTLPVYGTGPGGPFHIYRRDALPAEIRQGP